MKSFFTRFFRAVNSVSSSQNSKVTSLVVASVLTTSTTLGVVISRQSSVSNDNDVFSFMKKGECASASKETVSLEKGSREERFLEFASVECNGLVLMTPADFLESATQQQPRFHKSRLTISEKDAQQKVKNTPSKRYGSTQLFRSLDKDGLITYTEYLFLLCVLTKPKSGFKIAFNMFDTDLNEQVDKGEFLVMERTMQVKKAEIIDRLNVATDSKSVTESWFLLKLLNKLIIGQPILTEVEEYQENISKDEDSRVQSFPEINTTMLMHFFGKNGRDKLSFNEFAKFMDNLQTEILEIEFVEFSKGLKTISESEFAKILLRYTTVEKDKYDEYIRRVVDNIQMEQGITFEDFKTFFQFLNNIEDFILAMKMYTLADRPISRHEFHQAVKACTNTTLSKQLVKTIFFMFDEDGDGQLSYQEFVQSMKNRLTRGFSSSHKNKDLWKRYRTCVSEHLYNNY